MSQKPAAPKTRSVVTGVQKMTPSEAFVETMVANNVTDMFGIMGSAFMDAMDIFAPAGIRLIPVVHEQGAGHMADGYARVSGRHGVVIGQNGPGISNCVTAIAAAYWAHSPVVMITPETGTTGIGLGGFQHQGGKIVVVPDLLAGLREGEALVVPDLDEAGGEALEVFAPFWIDQAHPLEIDVEAERGGFDFRPIPE